MKAKGSMRQVTKVYKSLELIEKEIIELKAKIKQSIIEVNSIRLIASFSYLLLKA